MPLVRGPSLALLASLLVTTAAFPQASRTDRDYTATFATTGQSMWGPGTQPLSGFDREIRIVNQSWNVGDTTGDIRSFDTFLGTLAFGGEIGAFSRGNFGVFTRFADVSTGEVRVNYPVQVTLGIPDANSFRDGQLITIPTSLSVLSGANIATVQPHGSITLTGTAALAAGAHTKVCIFGCTTFPLFPSVDFDLGRVDVLSMGVDAEGAAFAQFLGLPKLTLPHELSFIEEQITNMSGTVALPHVVPVTTVQPDGRLLAAGRDTFFDIKFDIDGLVSLRIPLGFETPNFHGAHLKYETVDLSAVITMFQDHSFSFTPTVFATFTFPQDIEWWEENGAGSPVASGVDAVITIRAGNTLKLRYPSGLKEPIPVTPVFSIRNTFTTSVVQHFAEDLVLTVGEFELTVPRTEIFPEVTVDLCKVTTVDADFLDVIPDEFCPVTTPAVHTPEISIDLGPLFQQTLFGLAQQLPMFPLAGPDCEPGSEGCGRWELQGFNTAPGAAFVLDPENPIITVATTIASGLATNSGPPGSITQTIAVTNAGDVALSATQVADALAQAVAMGGGFTFIDISSLELEENIEFDGVADPNTLTRADVLAVGGSGIITVNIGTEPGNLFTADLVADGTSPIGTNVTANASASFGVFAFDIRPILQTTSAAGVLPVVVLGTAGMDPATIDPASVRLEGVAPLRWAIEVRDGFNDLTLKFDRQEIIAALEARIAAGAVPVASATAAPGAALPDAARVARALLGGDATLSEDERRAADRNGNGVVDVGDLRALLLGAPAEAEPEIVLAMAGPLAGAPGGNGGGGGGAGGGVPAGGATLILVLTGTLQDGTPFMGEDLLTIKTNGGGQ